MSSKSLVAVLAVTTMLAGSAAFAEAPSTSSQAAALPPGHAAVAKDFGTLSADGARAYQDLNLARLAIFDGRTADAKKYVDDADAGFNKAKGDESVFNQAEATMRSRVVGKQGSTASHTTASAAGNADKTDAGAQAKGSANDGSDVNKPVAWLPVDGAISINEDFTAKPDKAKAVQDANKSLSQGDRKGAMEKLKLAEIDTSVTLAVLPLQQTLQDVNQAKQLIDSGKFYEGSQKLRAVQDATVLTIADMPAAPGKTSTQQNGSPAGH